MADPDYKIATRDVIAYSGILNVAASTCAGIIVSIVDRSLGAREKWYLILVLSLAPGSPSIFFPIIKRDISLHGYVVVGHVGLFLGPILDRFVWMGMEDEFLDRLGIIEWQLRAYFFRSVAGWALSTLWAFRSSIVTTAALLLGAWVLLSHLAPSARRRIWRGFLLGTIAGTKYVFMRDFSIRAALFRLHDHSTMPLNRWEKEVAKRKRHAAEAAQRPTPFVYRRLESPRHIRLLKLKRKSWFNAPSCELVHVCLDDLHQDRTPAYEAVSYTWGPKPPSITLDVDGQQLLVTAAVENLLFHRRSSFTPVYLWIDAVCINQSSTAEKDIQLPLMREIYQGAQRTLVWLDTDEPPNAHEAAAVRKFVRSIGLPGSILGDKFMPAMLQLFEHDKLAYLTVGRLLSHPWFNRIWIFQEVAVSQEIHVLVCGTCLDWFTLAGFLERLKNSGQLERRLKYWMSPIASAYVNSSVGLEMTDAKTPGFYQAMTNVWLMSLVRHRVLTGVPLPLGVLILSTRFFASTDPRDMVFSLLGIAGDGHALPFKPQYGRPVADTFIDAASYVLSSDRARWSIHLANAGRGYQSIFTDNTNSALSDALPSWVPDYTSGSIIGMRTPHPNLLPRIDPSGTVTVLTDRPCPCLLLSATTLSPLSTVTHLTDPLPVLKHPTLEVNRTAINLDSQIFQHLSNANRPARQWYAAAVNLVLSHSSQPVEFARQRLWELLIDPHLASNTASSEEPTAPISSPWRPPDSPPLYPIHSAQARRLFDQYIGISSPERCDGDG
ncbi:hypothetical protein VTI74DRAFT_5139 [Chaetomium olivicolor]